MLLVHKIQPFISFTRLTYALRWIVWQMCIDLSCLPYGIAAELRIIGSCQAVIDKLITVLGFETNLAGLKQV